MAKPNENVSPLAPQTLDIQLIHPYGATGNGDLKLMLRFAKIILTFCFTVAAGPCLMTGSGVHAAELPAMDMECHEAEQTAPSVRDCECCDEAAIKPAKQDLEAEFPVVPIKQNWVSTLSATKVALWPLSAPPDHRQSLPIYLGDRLLA